MSRIVLIVVLLLALCLLSADGRSARLQHVTRPGSSRPAASGRVRVSPVTGQLIAVPTADQLRFQEEEIAVLIHYNIATYLPTRYDGCNSDISLTPPASLFNPYLLDTDNWVQSMVDLGARAATLVVKHNCGFTTWPTAVKLTLTDGSTVPYNYSIAYSPVRGTDLVADFTASCHRRQISTGFYYSVVWNNYLNVANGVVQNNTGPGQVPITQATYDSTVLQQLTELWSNYGALDEIWFDGGYREDQYDTMRKLIGRDQPHAVIFNGCSPNGVADDVLCVSNSSVRWIGTEDGSAPDPCWSTGITNDGGDPASPVFCPAECDTTLQNNDRWFWGANQTLRPLTELINVYHTSVGHNCKLEMDFTPDNTGLIPANYAARYAQLGQFIRSCYSAPQQEPASVLSAPSTLTTASMTLMYSAPTAIDRLVLQEDQRQGQLIRKYVVEGQQVGSMDWVQLSAGTSVGNKKIDLLPAAVTLTAVRFNVTDSVDTPRIRRFSAHLCDTITQKAVQQSLAAERE